MNRTLTILAAVACALSGLAFVQAAPDVALTRLDCGTPQAPTAVNQALANKLARIAWSVLAHGRAFEANKLQAAA